MTRMTICLNMNIQITLRRKTVSGLFPVVPTSNTTAHFKIIRSNKKMNGLKKNVLVVNKKINKYKKSKIKTNNIGRLQTEHNCL